MRLANLRAIGISVEEDPEPPVYVINNKSKSIISEINNEGV